MSLALPPLPSRFGETASCVVFGIIISFWFGICSIVQPYWHWAPGLWVPAQRGAALAFGIFFVTVGVLGFIKPRRYGFASVFPFCLARIYQGVETHDLYLIGIWTALILLSLWAVARRERELRGARLVPHR